MVDVGPQLKRDPLGASTSLSVAPNLLEVTELFRAFDAGNISRRRLEESLADRVLTLPSQPYAPQEPTGDDGMLAYKLAEAVCAATGSDEEVVPLVRRVLECLSQISDPGDALDLLPLIVHHDEFSVLVSKHARGLISPVGMRSVIAKRFSFDAVRPWLEAASLERLQAACERLESSDFRGLQSLLALP
jgi:hypothetical protein